MQTSDFLLNTEIYRLGLVKGEVIHDEVPFLDLGMAAESSPSKALSIYRIS